MIIEQVNITNENKGTEGWSDRDDFNVIRIVLDSEEDSTFIKDVFSEAEKLAKKVNSKGANTSVIRTDDVKLTDNVAGVLAEKIVAFFYRDLLGPEKVYTVEADSGFHQIDINLVDGREVEVRSSFVYHWPSIPLFKLHKEPSFEGHSTYNIPCTYTNGYKRMDFKKDFYTLVMFPSKKEEMINDLKNGTLEFFITGTASRIEEDNYGGIADLKGNAEASRKSYYKVVPVHKSLDVEELKNYLS